MIATVGRSKWVISNGRNRFEEHKIVWVRRPVLATMVRAKLSQLKTWKPTLKNQKRAPGGAGDEPSKAEERWGQSWTVLLSWLWWVWGSRARPSWMERSRYGAGTCKKQSGRAIVHTVSILSTKDHVQSSSKSGLSTSLIFLWIPPGSSWGHCFLCVLAGRANPSQSWLPK